MPVVWQFLAAVHGMASDNGPLLRKAVAASLAAKCQRALTQDASPACETMHLQDEMNEPLANKPVEDPVGGS